jgi:hypothetical protein
MRAAVRAACRSTAWLMPPGFFGCCRCNVGFSQQNVHSLAAHIRKPPVSGLVDRHGFQHYLANKDQMYLNSEICFRVFVGLFLTVYNFPCSAKHCSIGVWELRSGRAGRVPPVASRRILIPRESLEEKLQWRCAEISVWNLQAFCQWRSLSPPSQAPTDPWSLPFFWPFGCSVTREKLGSGSPGVCGHITISVSVGHLHFLSIKRTRHAGGVNYIKLSHLARILRFSTTFLIFFKNLPVLGRGVTDWTDTRLTAF